MEKMGEYGVSTFCLFVDFKVAYKSTDINGLFKAMEKISLPRKLRRLVEVTSENVRCKMKSQNGISDPFITRKELRQGDTLSCMLHNITVDKAVRVATLEQSSSLQILACADDIVVIGRYERAFKEAFIQLETAAKQMGLMINYVKTNYMELSNSLTRNKLIIINNRDIKNHGI
jgi:sorting nexin-29